MVTGSLDCRRVHPPELCNLEGVCSRLWVRAGSFQGWLLVGGLCGDAIHDARSASPAAPNCDQAQIASPKTQRRQVTGRGKYSCILCTVLSG